MHCRLYGYDADNLEACLEEQNWEIVVDGDVTTRRPKNFIRKPLCGTGGLKEALTSAGTFKDQKWRNWDPYYQSSANFLEAQYDFTISTPISKILALTAGGPFVGSAFENEQELLKFMRPLHDPITGGFDFVFAVGMLRDEVIGKIVYERSDEEEEQYWRGLNIIGCLNPEACDYALMASPSKRG